MKYFRQNNTQKVQVIVEGNQKQISSILEEVLEKYNLGNSQFDADLIIIVGNYTTFITGLNITKFNKDTIYVGINLLNYESLEALKEDIEKFIKFICESKDLEVIKIPLIGVNISKKYGVPHRFKAINNIDILGKFRYSEKIDELFFQTCLSEGVRITSNLNSMLYKYNSILQYDDKRLVRSLLGYDCNRYIPFFANPIPCTNYKIIIEKIYKDMILKVDNNELEKINPVDISYIEIEYTNDFIEILYLNDNFKYMDLLKIYSII